MQRQGIGILLVICKKFQKTREINIQNGALIACFQEPPSSPAFQSPNASKKGSWKLKSISSLCQKTCSTESVLCQCYVSIYTRTALQFEACEGASPHVLKSEQMPLCRHSPNRQILNALLPEFQNNPLCPSSRSTNGAGAN
uniref:Uncharacterized protein n=1 Tax=Aegilops tauschii subsp. strangulata TaxID=200361 RepID=A0A453AQ97_AEGTS